MSEFSTKYLELAKSAMDKAYAPYSKFKVGALVIAEDNGGSNKVYSGCNVENAAYPVGNCAEASAISAMILDGQTKIKAVVVMGCGDELVTPCGACRQRIREFSTNCPIYVCNPKELKLVINLKELLPFSFGPKNLKSSKD